MKSKSEKDYIEQIIPFAQEAQRAFGYLASVLIAQACQENGYGLDNDCLVLMDANNILGMKRELLNDTWHSDYWDGSYIVKPTPEWYNGRLTYINDAFRKYQSIKDCIFDYCQFMRDAKLDDGTYKYRAYLSIKDPAKLIGSVANPDPKKSYCTDPDYAKSVMQIIRKHNLTQYDIEKGEDEMGALNINRDYITTHNTNSTNDPRYIVIHNTDNERRGADAKAHAEGLYNGDMENMSWHYVVDDHSWYQCIEHNRGAWHVGKNYGSNNLFGIVHNRNSICIEMCVNAGYDYEAAFQNTVALTRYLMQELGIDADHVVSHYDVCSKDCPSAIRAHGDWSRFKQLITADTDEAPAEQEEKKNIYVAEFKAIHRGDTGDDVGTLQLGLRARDYKGENGKLIKVDKDFGGNTEHALREFQKDHGLKVDGWCGVLTWPVVLGRA